MRNKTYILIIISLFVIHNVSSEVQSGVCLQQYEADTISSNGTSSSTDYEDFFDPEAQKQKVKDKYEFSAQYRVETGYQQSQHRTENISYEDMYLHGGRLGVSVDFLLPKRFSLQTGLFYSLVYGTTIQKWGAISIEDYAKPDNKTGKAHSGDITHRVFEHSITIPVHTYYNIHLWKDLNLLFYSGPQLQLGLAMRDEMDADLSDDTRKWFKTIDQPYQPYDRYKENELSRCGVQWSLGGGIEWGKIRLKAGYDFGLNNLVKKKRIVDQQMWEWGWQVALSFSL